MERIKLSFGFIAYVVVTLYIGLSQSVYAAPVLLTFDVEKIGDAAKLKSLDIKVPATYYVLGKFAKENRDFVKGLATEYNTIGSHAYTHANLKEIPIDTAELELKSSKDLLEELSGRPVVWFRAPYLEYSDDVMQKVKEQGYLYDSSDHERWRKQGTLPEMPISSQDGTANVVSDYDIFIRNELRQEEALNWLKERYKEREKTKRPLVILLHPSIISEHASVLHDFIKFVQQEGGEFLSSDSWLKQYNDVPFNNVGLWVDYSVSKPNADTLIADARRIKTTDIYLMVADHEGHEYFSRTPQDEDVFGEMAAKLKKAGLKVHAWMPIFMNPRLAQINPEWTMKASNGTSSIHWLSPYNKEVRYHITETVKLLMTKYNLDGLHLDYIRFPDLDHDFSQAAIDGFVADRKEKNIKKNELLSKYYMDWVDYRAKTITDFVSELADIVHKTGDGNLELSAALIADAATNYRSQEKFGQNYAMLSSYIDTIIPMAYFKNERKEEDWIKRVNFAVRSATGSRKLFTGLSAYQQPQSWKMTAREFETSLKYAAELAGGVVFYNYANLFGRGDIPEWNMESSQVKFLEKQIPLYKAKKLSGDSGKFIKDKIILSPKIHNLLFAGGGAALTVIFIIGWRTLRKKRIHGISVDSDNGRKLEINISDVDFSTLEREISANGDIPAEMVARVSEILKSMGPQRISHFRRMRLLQMVKDKPVSVSLLQKQMATSPNMLSGLRRIEEAGVLGYIKIDSVGNATITSIGKDLLEKSVEDGYSIELINFIDQRLVEHLVICCNQCGANTLGHWFWDYFECSGCHNKFDITGAKSIGLSHS
ncbi:MAG: poly-beta-1,6-N-acetyl-D-glucosamine N-deacetylase PgaB [Rickettsiales bacterium]